MTLRLIPKFLTEEIELLSAFNAKQEELLSEFSTNIDQHIETVVIVFKEFSLIFILENRTSSGAVRAMNNDNDLVLQVFFFATDSGS